MECSRARTLPVWLASQGSEASISAFSGNSRVRAREVVLALWVED